MNRNPSFLVVDIETICGPEKPRPEDLKPPANMKRPETIEAYRADPKNINAAWKKEALVATSGRIHTVGFKIGGNPVDCVYHDGSDEEGMMREFEQKVIHTFKRHYKNENIHPLTICGHNVKTFDYPWIWLRARKWNLEKLLLVLGEIPQLTKIEDTMRWAVGNNYREFVSLDNALKFFNLGDKGDIDGSMVHDMWRDGKNKEIAEYCKDDVQKTYDLAVALGIILPDDEE